MSNDVPLNKFKEKQFNICNMGIEGDKILGLTGIDKVLRMVSFTIVLIEEMFISRCFQFEERNRRR